MSKLAGQGPRHARSTSRISLAIIGQTQRVCWVCRDVDGGAMAVDVAPLASVPSPETKLMRIDVRGVTGCRTTVPRS